MLEKACELLKTATLHLIFMANVYHRSYRGARIGHSSKPSGIPKLNTVPKLYIPSTLNIDLILGTHN